MKSLNKKKKKNIVQNSKTWVDWFPDKCC